MNSQLAKVVGVFLLFSGCGLLAWGLSRVGTAAHEQTTARIKLEFVTADASGKYDPLPFNSALIQTEIGIMRSNAILGKILEDPDRAKDLYAADVSGKKPEAAEALARFQRQLDLLPVQGTSLIDIQVVGVEPAASCRLANAVAETYRAYKLDERKRTLSRSFADTIQKDEERWRNLGHELNAAREQLTALQLEAGIAGDGTPDTNTPPEKIVAYQELKLRVQNLKARRTELETELGAEHKVPKFSSVLVEIIHHAALPFNPGQESGRLVTAGLVVAGGLCAGGGLFLFRRREGPTPPLRK